jgi:hypothetical protein
MIYTLDQIVALIGAHIKAKGGLAGDWYVGIAYDPQARFPHGQMIPLGNPSLIIMPGISIQTAREAEAQLLSLGHKGDEGSSDPRSTFVYAYRITSAACQP